MKLGLDIRTSLTQTLTPQQIQYLKLLQMSVVEFEQYLEQEIEQNPLVEDPENPDSTIMELAEDVVSNDDDINVQPYTSESVDIAPVEFDDYEKPTDDYDNFRSQIDEENDPFEFQKLLWQDDTNDGYDSSYGSDDDDDFHPFQIKDNESFADDIESQLNLLPLNDEEKLAGKFIIGNVDEDGYLRLELEEVLNFVNSHIAEYNFQIQQKEYLKKIEDNNIKSYNPASQFAISEESKDRLEYATLLKDSDLICEAMAGRTKKTDYGNYEGTLSPVSMTTLEKVHHLIKHLDPPGVGSRTMQECLIAQLDSINEPTVKQKSALNILRESFEPFTKKHFDVLMNKHNIDRDELKEILELIKRLNPKPGRGNSVIEMNTVIPDFVIEKDKENNELMIALNDNRMPSLKVSRAYEILKKNGKLKKFNKETKEWLRQKNEDAKFIVQAIQQRKITMMKVMTAIAHLQNDFFYYGKSALKPLIYKDVADITGIDISTVCRIVNNKYVLTEFGTYELKFFFSESLPSDGGEDISTTVIKDTLKEMIEQESKENPYSDDALAVILKEKGFNVARRTVAKYREQLKLPVARLRKEL